HLFSSWPSPIPKETRLRRRAFSWARSRFRPSRTRSTVCSRKPRPRGRDAVARGADHGAKSAAVVRRPHGRARVHSAGCGGVRGTGRASLLSLEFVRVYHAVDLRTGVL